MAKALLIRKGGSKPSTLVNIPMATDDSGYVGRTITTSVVDLGSLKKITAGFLCGFRDGATAGSGTIYLQGSTDNSTWVTIFSEAYSAGAYVGVRMGYLKTGGETSYRYLRMQIYTTNQGADVRHKLSVWGATMYE